MPTILEIAGVPKPKGWILDGESFLPIVKGEKNVPWRDALYLEVGHTRAVRTGKWKYLTIRHAPALKEKLDTGTLDRKPWHADTIWNPLCDKEPEMQLVIRAGNVACDKEPEM